MSARSKVLSAFKKLHRTRQVVFEGDENALSAIRNSINEEFRKRMDEKDPATIEEMIKLAEDSEMVLRTTVVQAEVTDGDTYKLKLREDNLMTENVLFDPNADIPTKRRSKKSDDTPS